MLSAPAIPEGVDGVIADVKSTATLLVSSDVLAIGYEELRKRGGVEKLPQMMRASYALITFIDKEDRIIEHVATAD